ncbi:MULTISPECIES: FtsK/SpoIIIE domain-containing protein [unclassified Candidatus Frackibacter]|uniref:FtsK/SpoIIIE domain-containing protein n=1 Tax=unclassified Candidatus Frackibacter TaxID=2648818 RepID=UPI00088C0EB0|nr:MULTISPECIES: FtsK/SpoIIIE domain-containing protein [unclassified Candidatus Frackibacter]SDC30815.1 FtsK/SpoIIIE family protein [Candidatus Frackibacter sp. WG11]SEM73926.1 FtsK/SpoIIIE family protein [Candidatus Frackibacter sp. WG12]SFL58682.1 FtsK/SpoIIIE family protein [Candidatus Frackibacter sp. WG13]
MSIKNVVSNLLASSIIKRVQNESFGIMLKDLPNYSYESLLQSLHTETANYKLDLPYIFFVGYKKEEINTIKQEINDYKDLFKIYFTVEDAEKFRNKRDVSATRVVIVKRKVSKLTSLEWYEKIEPRELYDNLCNIAKGELGEINNALGNLWQAFKHNKIRELIPLQRLVNYYQCFIDNNENETQAAILEMYRLGILIDENLFERNNVKSIRKRIRDNKKLVSRISRLNTTDQRALQSSDIDRTDSVIASVLKYYKTRDYMALKNLKYKEVVEALSNVNKKKRGKKRKKKERRRNNKDTTPKSIDSTGVDLIIKHDDEQIEDILDQVEDKYDNWDESEEKNITIKSADKRINIKLIPEVSNLIEAFVGSNTYGGVIKAEVSSPVDALNSISENNVIKAFDDKFVEQIREILKKLEKEFDDITGLINQFNCFISQRNKLVKQAQRLADSPILKIAESEKILKEFTKYIRIYSRFMHLVKEKYNMFEVFSRDGTKELIARINSLDIVYIIDDKETHAILTPLNPLYLWKYVELTRRLSETSSDLSKDDKEFLIRSAEDIPNPLSTLFVSNFITNKGDIIIPEVGCLGKLPIYSSVHQVNNISSGLSRIKKSLKKLVKTYPHSSFGLRIAFVNPPSVKIVFEKILKKLVKGQVIDGAYIYIYRTKETSYNWASFEGVDDEILNKFGLSPNINYSIKIDNKIRKYNEVANLLGDNACHGVVMFDACNRAIVNNRRKSRLKLKIHPLCVPNIFKYDPITDDLQIIPSSEGDLFSDYHDLVAKLNDKPRGWYHAVALEAETEQKVFDKILDNTIWLILADDNLKKLELTTIGPKKCIYYETNYKTNSARDLGIYSRNWSKLINGLDELIRSIGNYDPDNYCLEQVLREIRRLNEKGILHLTSYSLNRTFDEKHTKGAIGLAVAAYFYKHKNENPLLISLDTALAQGWLEERKDSVFSDLIGIYFKNGEAYVDVIEVKTYKDYSLNQINDEVIEINGNAVDQVNAVQRIINEIFYEQDKITSTSRREILRFQVFNALYQKDLDTNQKKYWTDNLNELFGGDKRVNINSAIYHIHLNDHGETNYEGIECHNENRIILYEIKDDFINKVFNNCKELNNQQNIKDDIVGEQNKHNENDSDIIKAPDSSYFDQDNAQNNDDGQMLISDDDKEKHDNLEENIQEDRQSNASKKEEDIKDDESNDITIEQKEMKTIEKKAKKLMRAMKDYSIDVAEIDPKKALIASRFIRFRVRLRPGETLKNVKRYRTDIAREIEAISDILVDNEGGSQYIYVDVPRETNEVIELLDYTHVLPSEEVGNLNVIMGQEPNGNIEINNIVSAPHMLIAGSTGSGKTIFLYSILVSLISQYSEEELELVVIDPKQTDFIFFEGLPHLRNEQVIINAENAVQILTDLFENELERRTNLLRESRSRDLFSYNRKNSNDPMKPIAVIIDEYADLVQAADLEGSKDDFERNIVRLAQRARNVGIHLIIATQRPSADIVTSRLKANIPTRVSFRLPANQDSRTILDTSGAEDLLGKGDMLYSFNGKIKRLQGLYISEDKLEKYLQNK